MLQSLNVAPSEFIIKWHEQYTVQIIDMQTANGTQTLETQKLYMSHVCEFYYVPKQEQNEHWMNIFWVLFRDL